MDKRFKHLQAAHCENGVTTALLKHRGVDFITEPLAFGIGSGLFYIQIPFLTVNNGPAISFRTMPGAIFARTCKSLGIQVVRKKFSREDQAEAYVDRLVQEGIPVGCQVGVFHLPYFPVEYRFHFNAHNLIVFDREDDRYLVSDPVMETATQLTVSELTKVRFAKGPLAPQGQAYYPIVKNPVDHQIIRSAIIKGIKRNIRDMLHIPGGFAGVNGIKYTAKRVRRWRDKLGARRGGLFLGQIVRMQEEIGTGGGGFRYLYAAFLEQAHAYLQDDELLRISEDFTKAGDMWRHNAVKMAGVYKGRTTEQSDFDEIADRMEEIREVEKSAFKRLSSIKSLK